MKVLDLFSGIGGFSLGLGAAGFETIAFVEIDEFCQEVLHKHWPDVPIYSDIRDVIACEGLANVFCGGFPCQDVSLAKKKGESILGDRSGLWFEYHRLITEGHPDWVVIENVENLRSMGLIIILRQLADLGYDAEWHVIPAYSVGLPHRRRRLWVVAHARSHGFQRDSSGSVLRFPEGLWHQSSRAAQEVLSRWDISITEPLRSYNGIPDYVDRVKALGNSVIPQIAYNVGLGIKEAIMRVKIGLKDGASRDTTITYEEWCKLWNTALTPEGERVFTVALLGGDGHWTDPVTLDPPDGQEL